MKKLGMCSVLSCSEQATGEIRYKSGAVGEYCDRHYAARTLGRLGGSVRSEAKAAAARENGSKGGRPRAE